MVSNKKQSLRVVLVENDDDDVFFIERALRHAGFSQPLTRLADGQYAIDYFSRLPKDAVPDVVLMDLKMPRKDGFELLSWIRHQPDLSALPVVMLTSSDDPADIRKAKSSGATKFLTKDCTYREVVESLEGLFSLRDGG